MRHWVEDRFVNAITPLDIRLQREMPGVMAADATLQSARGAVQRVMAAVEEIRRMTEDRGPGTDDGGPAGLRSS